MKRIGVGLLVGLLVSVMTCNALWAQATAQIGGSVHDMSGAVLPGVEITATQTGTGASRMTITNETGYYILPNLPLGPYRVEASLPGFRSFVQTGIVLQVNSNPTLNIVLQVGQVTEQVEVQANATLVETRSIGVGQVMETARIVELPLNGRNAQELLLLGGGAVQTSPVGGSMFPGRLQISSAGALGTATEYTLDGVRHVDSFDGIPLPLPFPDALAEFKTELGGSGGQQGRSSQVSAVTKSGTNDLHGDLFEFVRNDLFNARSYFAIKGSTLKRNQFGGTLGGAILKNKLFFFGGYQGTTLRQDAADVQQFVPTAAMLAGDFTGFTSPACNANRQVTLRAPFVNNRIDPALFSPVALKVAARLPKPDNPTCGQITFGRRSVENDGQVVGRIDYQSSAKHSLFGRFISSSAFNPSSLDFTPDLPMNSGASSTSGSYAFSFGSTYLVSPTTVNAFRLAFTRTRQTTIPKGSFDLTELGAKVYSGFTPHVTQLTVTGGFTISGGNFRITADDLYQLADDVSMTRGTHQLAFGGRVGQSRTIFSTRSQSPPGFSFSSAQTGAGLADFLLGKASDFTQGSNTEIFARVKQLSLYFQDTWQAKRRVTVNYSVRWAPILPHVDNHRPVPFVMNFDMDRYRQGLRSTVFVNSPPGFLYAGDPGFAQNNNGANAEKPHADVWNPYWTNFAPRLGLAWDVQGNGRTSIRASYGLNYEDYPTAYRLGEQSAAQPFGGLIQLIAPAGGLEDPWRDTPGGTPFPLRLTKNIPFIPGGNYVPNNPTFTPTYTQSWNLSLQREVTAGMLMSVSYLGTQIVHLQATNPINRVSFVPGIGDANGNCFLNGQVTYYKVAPGSPCSVVANTQARRALSFLNPAFATEIGRLGIVTYGGTQQYNGMLVSVQRRPSDGINFSANYTLSHCIGDYTGRTSNGFGSSSDHTYQDPDNRRKDRASCDMDQRHNFNLTGSVETPKFTNRTVSLLGSGWRLSGIYRASTGGTLVPNSTPSGAHNVTLGTPGGALTSTAGVDQCLCNLTAQRPNLLLPGAVYLDTSGRPGTQWLNPAAFGQPALGTLGNLGRNAIEVPMTWQLDVGLSRVFNVRETQRMEFRVEAYNVINAFRPGTIDTNLSSTNTFGKIRTALDPRIMQFALKYLF